jgi:O-Antigen ligase
MVLPAWLLGGLAVFAVLGAVTAVLVSPIWGIALVMVALCASVTARRPALGVAVLFVCGVLLVDISALSVYRYFLLSDLLFLSAFALQTWIDRRTEVYYPRLLTWLFVVYLAAHFIAFSRSNDASSAPTWLHSAFVMLAYTPILTTLMVRRPELKRILFVTVMVTGGLQACIVIANVANGLDWQKGTRIAGAFGSAHLWLYAAAAVAAVGVFLTGNPPARIGSLLVLMPIGLAEAFLRSRMLWIATFVGISLMLILQSRRRLLGFGAVAALSVLLVAGFMTGGYPDAIERRINDALKPTETADLVARLQVIYELANSIEQSPLVGLGVAQSPTYLTEHQSSAKVVSVHNIIMHAAVEGGVLAGLAVALMPIAIAVLLVAAARAESTAVRFSRLLLSWEGASLAAIYLAAQLTPTLYEHTFYLLLAALASTSAQLTAPPWPQAATRAGRQ